MGATISMNRLRVLLMVGIAACTLAVLFITSSPAAAQSTAPSVRAPDSIEVILGALGFVALVVIGVIYWARSTSGPDEEDEE